MRGSGVRSSADGRNFGGKLRNNQGDDRAKRPPRGENAQRTAGQCDHHALRQQLHNQPAATGPYCEPHRDLLLPRGGACEQQVGEIGAGDQQHQADRRENDGADAEYRQTALRQVHQGGLVDDESGGAPGLLLVDVSGDNGKIGTRGGKARIRLQSAGDFQPAQVVLVQVLITRQPLLLHGDGSPDGRAEEARAGEALGRHTDDGERHTIQHNGLSQDCGLACKIALPEVVADHYHGVRTGSAALVVAETAAERHSSRQHREVITGDEISMKRAGSRARQGKLRAGIGDKPGEGVVLVAIRLIFGVGEEGAGAVHVAALESAIDLVDSRHFAGVPERQRAKGNGVEQREDGGVHSDSKGQSEHRDHGKSRGFAVQAQAVAKILEQSRHRAVFSLETHYGDSARMFPLSAGRPESTELDRKGVPNGLTGHSMG